MENTKRKWEELRLRHRELFRQIRRELPGFWAEVAELGQTYLEETVTSTGAVVREFPKTREIGTQTEEERTSEKGKSRGTREQGVQTPKLEVSLAALEAAADREPEETGREDRSRDRDRSEYRRPGRSPGRRAVDCWNCGSREHRYAACPRPRSREFCYRCGKEGITIKDCPQCRANWKEEGPYRPGKSTPRDPLRRNN